MTRLTKRPGRWHRVAASTILAVGFVAAFPSAADAAPATVVTIQFDDGNADAYQWISGIDNHGFHATYYVNSGSIDTAGKLTWAQLTSLSQAGNEIASHTVDHVNIKKLKLADARFQVCQDRVNLAAHGFQPESFAYPSGPSTPRWRRRLSSFAGTTAPGPS